MRAIDADALIDNICRYASPEMAWDRIDIVHKINEMPTIEERKTGKWSGLWSEPQDDKSIYGEKLIEGDTVYLLGIEGTVRQENGAWGWGSCNYVPWELLENKIPHNNKPSFCYCDNFISFWELKWNFDDGEDWDGVPFIRHNCGAKMEGEQP